MVADNNLALGMVVEGLSKSQFWKETAIFVLEDDAQNGPDLKELKTAQAWGANQSVVFDLSKEDADDDLAFNEVIWRSAIKAKSPMPVPVRAAFFLAK